MAKRKTRSTNRNTKSKRRPVPQRKALVIGYDGIYEPIPVAIFETERQAANWQRRGLVGLIGPDDQQHPRRAYNIIPFYPEGRRGPH